MDIGELLRVARLVQQDFERGKVGVPLDQCGHGTEAPERRGVEVPDGLGNPGGVVVDQDIHVFGGVMASKMDLADCPDRQCIEIGDRVEDGSAVSPFELAAAALLRDDVKRLLGVLDEREGKILRLRFGLDQGDPRTLEEVAREFRLSRERVRQIEAKALAKLRHPDIANRSVREILDR